MNFRKAFDYAIGLIGLALGIVLFLPGFILLFGPLWGFYTVGLTPNWLRWALYALSVLSIIQIVGAVNSIRWAGKWE